MADMPVGSSVELVADRDRPAGWTVLADGFPQSHVDLDDPRYLEFEYVRRLGHLIDLAAPAGQPLRALHLGGGGLTLARYVAATRPGSPQLAVDSDAALVDLVRQRLPLDQPARRASRPGPRVRIRVRVGDARAALEQAGPGSFDLVLADLFAGGRTPAHLISAEFTAAAARALAAPGIFAVNIGDGRPLAHAGPGGDGELGLPARLPDRRPGRAARAQVRQPGAGRLPAGPAHRGAGPPRRGGPVSRPGRRGRGAGQVRRGREADLRRVGAALAGPAAGPTGVTQTAQDQPPAQAERIRSAAISAIMVVGALVLPLITVGMTEASTTRRPPTNMTGTAWIWQSGASSPSWMRKNPPASPTLEGSGRRQVRARLDAVRLQLGGDPRCQPRGLSRPGAAAHADLLARAGRP